MVSIVRSRGRERARRLIGLGSALTYHLAATARRRPEPGRAADLHLGAAEHVGEDYQVRIESG